MEELMSDQELMQRVEQLEARLRAEEAKREQDRLDQQEADERKRHEERLAWLEEQRKEAVEREKQADRGCGCSGYTNCYHKT